jgi:hypothetical protein
MSSSVGHQISSTSAWLMHDVINKTLSHKIDFQLVPHDIVVFHLKNESLGINFDDLLDITKLSPIMMQ